jgi:hypothetical protein
MTNATRIRVDHNTVKHLGTWTTDRTFDVRARHSTVVIDLRSPHIAEGDIELTVDLDHALLKLLLPTDATLDQWGLRWTGNGRVKDGEGPAADASTGGRHISLTGHIDHGEIRVHRGGMAVLSAMVSRAYLADLRQAHRTGTTPTVDDPTRTKA